jgi:hypothetical protein
MLHRRNLEQASKFQHRLEQEAIKLRKQAEGMPPGIRREELLRKSNQLDMTANVNKWLWPSTAT